MKYQRLKDVAAVFVIVFLLPYVISILVSGFPKKDAAKTSSPVQNVCIGYENRQETISLQEYLIGALAAQMPVDYRLEALKAHAVLVRTYYMKYEKDIEVIKQNQSGQAFLSKEQMKNLWGEKFEENYRKLEQAVVDTGEECLYYKEQLMEPYFHAVSAGNTRNGTDVFQSEEYEYLQACSCQKDLLADNYVTIKTFTKEELEEVMEQFQAEEPDSATADAVEVKSNKPMELFNLIKTDSSGYVTRIELDGRLMHGETFRNVMQLPSAAFSIEEWDGGVRFVCKGLGHGLGMSLYTANELAGEGKNYQEILQYFFKNVTITAS